MSAARCPKCSASLLGSVEWCSQCYADVRPPPPAAPPAPAAPAPAPAAHAPVLPDVPLTALVAGPLDTPLALATAAAMADPLTAPIGVVAGAEPAAAAVAAAAGIDEPAAPSRPAAAVEGWPCVRCGAVNPMEHMACGSCGYAFGSELSTPLHVPGTRQSRIVVTVGIVFGVLAMLAVLVYASTPEPPPEVEPTPGPVVTQPLDEVEEPAA